MKKLAFILSSVCFALSLAFAQDEPITLRLAVADFQDQTSAPYALEFIEQARVLSNGTITIEPTWTAWDAATAFFEAGVIELVTSGRFDLGLISPRAWDNEGVTNFQALQAPFLITDEALAKAVATSDIAARMLTGMASAGIVGLSLWPEDLRHPYAFDVSGKTFLSPEDFAGSTIRAPPSSVTWSFLEALGAEPVYYDNFDPDVLAGRIQGAEVGLRVPPRLAGAATGNVVFFPKFQMLFANASAFEELSEEQQSILQEAAVRARDKAIAEYPSQVDSAAELCAAGATVVMASDEQLAAFEEAARPVFEQIEQDPLNAEFIAAIRDLKASTEPSPGAQACSAETAQQPDPTAETEAEVWSEGLPPNGTWQVVLSADDFMAMSLTQPAANDWAGIHTYTLQDGQGLYGWDDEDGDSGSCEITYSVVEDFVRFNFPSSDCGPAVDDLKWRLEEDGLRFHLLATDAPYLENKAMYETRPWRKID